MTSKRHLAAGYAAVLSTPGLPALAALSAIGRLGLGTASLALVLSIASRTGSFAIAGWGTAAYAAASGMLAPVRGWVADRYGTAPTVGLLGTACGLALLTIVPSARLGAAALVVTCAAAGALTPSLGAITKARLSMIFHSDDHARQLACSSDAVIDIMALVAGPGLAGVMVSAASADVALAASAALIILGSLGTSATSPIRHHRRPAQVPAALASRTRHVITQPVLRQTVVAMCGAGAAIGAVEVIVPAFAARQHAPGMSGAVLGILFGASSLSGLLYGRFRWSSALARRYRVLIMCLAASLIPLTLAHSIMGLAILVALPGLAFGPTLISAFLLAQQSAAAEQQNQANAWITTANTAGAALGLALGGFIATKTSLTVTLLIPALLAAGGALAAIRLGRARMADAQPRRADA